MQIRALSSVISQKISNNSSKSAPMSKFNNQPTTDTFSKSISFKGISNRDDIKKQLKLSLKATSEMNNPNASKAKIETAKENYDTGFHLIRLIAPENLDLLAPVFKQKGNCLYKMAASQKLLKEGDSSHVAMVLPALRNTNDLNINGNIRKFIAKEGTIKQINNTLVSVLNTKIDKDTEKETLLTIGECANAIAESRRPEFAPVFREKIKTTHNGIYSPLPNMIKGLAMTGEAKDLKSITPFINPDKYRKEVVIEAIKAVGELGTSKDIKKALAPILNTDNSQFARTALTVIEKIGTKENIPQAEALKNAPHQERAASIIADEIIEKLYNQ